MTKFISMMWTEGVEDEEAWVAVQTVYGIIQDLYRSYWPQGLIQPPVTLKVFGNWVIPSVAEGSPYWGTQWYVDTSYDPELDQVIGPVFLTLVQQEPWQQSDPHFDIALIDQDLTDLPSPAAHLKPGYFALGTSLPGIASVVSVHRVRQIANKELRRQVLRRLVMHHLGHSLGIPRPQRTVHVEQTGLEWHCTSICVMRHADNVTRQIAYALEEANAGITFCVRCTQDLLSTIIQTQYVLS